MQTLDLCWCGSSVGSLWLPAWPPAFARHDHRSDGHGRRLPSRCSAVGQKRSCGVMLSSECRSCVRCAAATIWTLGMLRQPPSLSQQDCRASRVREAKSTDVC